MGECCVAAAQSLLDLPPTMLAKIFTLIADVYEENPIWADFSPRFFAELFGGIAERQAGPPRTFEEGMAALEATLIRLRDTQENIH